MSWVSKFSSFVYYLSPKTKSIYNADIILSKYKRTMIINLLLIIYNIYNENDFIYLQPLERK